MATENFLYVATHKPSRKIYYYCWRDDQTVTKEWSPHIHEARLFDNDRVLAPVRAGRKLTADYDHRFVRLNP